jgi:hypothetical protein
MMSMMMRATAWRDDPHPMPVEHVRLIPMGASIERAKGARSVSSSSALAVTTGNSLWLSAMARPWPGMCLMQPVTPARASPSSTARPSAATASGSLPPARDRR